MSPRSRTAQNGFTLIEIMIVVAIIAILATVSYSSYRNNVVRSNRAAAVSYIMEVANKQERYLLDNRDYAADMSTLGINAADIPDEVSDNYNVTTGPVAGITGPSYQVTATPTGSQDSDDTECGWLQLDYQGNRSTEHGGTRCWR